VASSGEVTLEHDPKKTCITQALGYFGCFEGQGAPHGAQAPTKSCGETARPCDGLVK
jgi:hypothetical protein